MPLQTFNNTSNTFDPTPTIRSAGLHSHSDTNTAKHCMVHTKDNTFIRTTTPTSLQQVPLHNTLYRKQEPGIRYIHGIHNTDAINNINPHDIHGVVPNRGTVRTGDTLYGNVSQSELQSYIQQQREKIYRSTQKPIGRTTQHKYIDTIDLNTIHGITSDSSESAKNLIYKSAESYTTYSDPLKADTDVTKRINRQYTGTHIDIHQHRHGKIYQHNALNSSYGVTAALQHSNNNTVIGSEREQQIRYLNSKPTGAAVRTVQLPDNFVAGARVQFDSVGTYDCIRGNYTVEQQQPDMTIGKTISVVSKLRPHSNIDTVDTTRVYGVPSIRTDLHSIPARRSMASEVNYGDECNAAQLIQPYVHVPSGVDMADLTCSVTREYLCTVYNQLGLQYTVENEEFNVICDTAEQLYGILSIDSFRHAYNQLNVQDENLNSTRSSMQTTRTV